MRREEKNPALKIRPFKPADLESVVEIENESFPHPWPSILFKRMYRVNPDGFKVVVFKSRVVGYGVGRLEMREGSEIEGRMGHLLDLAVDEDYRRRGVGTSLLREMENYFSSEDVAVIWFEVREGNEEARSFYTENGYRGVEIISDYYPDGANAMVMRKEIY